MGQITSDVSSVGHVVEADYIGINRRQSARANSNRSGLMTAISQMGTVASNTLCSSDKYPLQIFLPVYELPVLVK